MDSVLNPFQGYAIFAKVEEGEDENAPANDYAKNYFDDSFNSHKQDTPRKEPVSLTRDG